MTLSRSQIAQVRRTVDRSPEVMVKVSGGAKSTWGAVAHLDYIDRQGALEIETDDGRTLQGRDVAADLTGEWDLDTAQAENRNPYRGRAGRAPVKLLHNVVFSMPKGTPPEKLHQAVRGFAREQFAGKHRYAMVLHTDHDHPHVHLVVRAMSEEGRQLNLRKATLREWRSRFAEQLRAQGVDANATTRAERGQTRAPLKDGIYRAARRGHSTHLARRQADIVESLRAGTFTAPPGKVKLGDTRRAVVDGWQAAAAALLEAGNHELARKIWHFIGGMPAPLTTEEQLAVRIEQADRTRHVERDAHAR